MILFFSKFNYHTILIFFHLFLGKKHAIESTQWAQNKFDVAFAISLICDVLNLLDMNEQRLKIFRKIDFGNSIATSKKYCTCSVWLKRAKNVIVDQILTKSSK